MKPDQVLLNLPWIGAFEHAIKTGTVDPLGLQLRDVKTALVLNYQVRNRRPWKSGSGKTED